jgi:uncharacterized membrane protein
MAEDTQSAALGCQSAQDAAVDRRVAAITRALKWVGWALLLVTVLMLVMALTPVPPLAVSDEITVSGVFIPFGVGALFLVRAARRRHRVSMLVGGIGFVLLALAIATLFIYGMFDAFRDQPAAPLEAAFIILVLSAIILSIALGLLVIGLGLLRLAVAFRKGIGE